MWLTARRKQDLVCSYIYSTLYSVQPHFTIPIPFLFASFSPLLPRTPPSFLLPPYTVSLGLVHISVFLLKIGKFEKALKPQVSSKWCRTFKSPSAVCARLCSLRGGGRGGGEMLPFCRYTVYCNISPPLPFAYYTVYGS